MIQRCISAIGSENDGGPSDEELEGLVRSLMAMVGNPGTLPKPSGKVKTEVNARFIEAWRAAAKDSDSRVCRWLVEGWPAGIEHEHTTCGIFPPVDKMGDMHRHARIIIVTR